MNELKLIVVKQESQVIKKLIEKYPAADIIEKESRQRLYNELKTAVLMLEQEIPKTIVRLNSIVSVKTSFGTKDGLQIVIPSEADLQRRKLSVMSSMGAAIYGYPEGKKVVWNLPNGAEEITIERVINE